MLVVGKAKVSIYSRGRRPRESLPRQPEYRCRGYRWYQDHKRSKPFIFFIYTAGKGAAAFVKNTGSSRALRRQRPIDNFRKTRTANSVLGRPYGGVKVKRNALKFHSHGRTSPWPTASGHRQIRKCPTPIPQVSSSSHFLRFFLRCTFFLLSASS